jgi:glutaredoxin
MKPPANRHRVTAPIRLLACALGLTVTFLANAQQYRWVDEKGHVQYTDTPPPASAKGIQKKNFNAGPAEAGTEPFALQVARKNAPVKLYTTPECGTVCDQARNLLNRRGIPFSEVLVADPALVDELKAVSGDTTVPVMLVGRTIQKGYEKGAYERALDVGGYPATGTLHPRNQVAPQLPKSPAEAPAKAATN